MTRKESDELLRKMRSTGCVLKVEHSYMDEEAAHPDWTKCLVATETRCYKLYLSDDKYISACGAGSWAVRNTFRAFYEELRYSELVEILPSNYYMWGL